MRSFIQRLGIEAVRLALGVAICASVVVSVTYAASLTAPTGTAPSNNVPAPVNVGSEYQEKTSDFWADSIGSTDGFCIAGSCITEWPTYATGSTCQLNTMIREDHNPGTLGVGCVPSAQEVADGWTLVSYDYCSSVRSSDCAWPYYCVYQQLSCTGSVSTAAGVVTETTYSSAGGDGGGGGCFSPETLVTMSDGTEKEIRDIAIGDSVLGADENGNLTQNRVTKVFIHDGGNDTLLLNGIIVVTGIHPIKTNRGWVEAQLLRIGDTLYTTNSTTVVSSIVKGKRIPVVYNLEVDPTHTYFAGGILVHNKLDIDVQVDQL